MRFAKFSQRNFSSLRESLEVVFSANVVFQVLPVCLVPFDISPHEQGTVPLGRRSSKDGLVRGRICETARRLA
jgi:hypothetical protein